MWILEKYKTINTAAKTAFWILFCNILIKTVNLITIPLFTKYLSTYEYGIVSLFVSYQRIFLILATLELSEGAYIRGLLKYKENQKLYTSTIVWLSMVITLIVFLFTIPFLDQYKSVTKTGTLTFLAMFLNILLQPSYLCWMQKNRYDYKYRGVVIGTLGYTLVSTLISLGCVLMYKKSAETKIISMLIVQSIFCFPFFGKYILNFDVFKKNQKVNEMIRFSVKFQLPLVLHSLSYFILGDADKIMIGYFDKTENAGIYSVAYSLACVLGIIQSSIIQVLRPWFYQKMEMKEGVSIKKIINLVSVGICIMIIIYLLVIPDIIKLLFTDSYYNSIWTIPPITLSVFLMFLYSCFVMVEEYFNKTIYVMLVSIICSGMNILLNGIGLKFFHYEICGYTTLISYTLFVILHYKFYKKILLKNGRKDILDIKFIIRMCLIMVMMLFVILMAYKLWIFRYLLLLTITGIGIIKRNNIRIFIKSVLDLKKGE